MCTLKNMNLFR